MNVGVSRHASQRLKERLGLNRKAARRYARQAFHEGQFPAQYPVTEISRLWRHKQENDQSNLYLIHRDFVHVFGLSKEKTPVLVTVFDPITPRELEVVYVSGEKRRS